MNRGYSQVLSVRLSFNAFEISVMFHTSLKKILITIEEIRQADVKTSFLFYY